MEIREATEADIPGIVDLLKVSLGEGLMPKSAGYWRWKHHDNPFGTSPTLLAFEKQELVGVRAFMRWNWQDNQQLFKAVRAVDTATHPKHQGKGIFKKLTLMLVEESRKDGVHFVFNTPNNSSKPGYLKMGWQVAGKLPICVKVCRPLSTLVRVAGLDRPVTTATDDSRLDYFMAHQGLAELLRKDAEQQRSIHTQVTVNYLKWRYKEVAVARYFAEGLEHDGQLSAVIFYRMKTGKAGTELRITDVFMESERYRPEVARLMKDRINSHDANFVTVSSDHKWILKSNFTFSSLKVGPIVTVRDLDRGPMNNLLEFRRWAPSLGDLELF